VPKVIIDMTMSLDGFVAGPEDGPDDPLGKHGGMAIFDFSCSPIIRPRWSQYPRDQQNSHSSPTASKARFGRRKRQQTTGTSSSAAHHRANKLSPPIWWTKSLFTSHRTSWAASSFLS
jgi:hypothetical protein